MEDYSDCYDSLTSDMQRLSVCDVSLENLEYAPYQPPNTLPLLIKANTSKPPMVSKPSSNPSPHSKVTLPSSNHPPASFEPLARSIRLEIFRTDLSHDSRDAEDRKPIPTLFFDMECAVSILSREYLLQTIAEAFQIPPQRKLLLKAYDPLLSCWISVLSERGLGVTLLHSLELQSPLKLSFRVHKPKQSSRQNDIALPCYRPRMKRTNFSKILLPAIKRRASELPFTFSRPQLMRNELIAHSKQDGLADSLENQLIATRW